MADPIAVLVEDDPQQSVVSQGVLAAAGFAIRNFESLSPALEYLRATADLIDLFVFGSAFAYAAWRSRDRRTW